MKNVKDILKINKEMGGKPLNTSSIEFALATGKEKSKYIQLAYLWRAILVDHPFSDGNKRTALALILNLKKDLDQERVVKSIIKIASKNIININKIERTIRWLIEEK